MKVRLLAALLVLLLAGPALAIKVVPEAFWFTIDDHGERVGFGRGEYADDGPGKYVFRYVLVLHLETSKTGEIGTYRFDDTLRPISFEQKTLFTNRSQAVTNTADGDFDWAKGVLSLKSREFDKDSSAEIPLVKGALSLFTTNLALAHSPLSVGKTFDFTVFSPQTKSFVHQHFVITKRDPKSGQFHFTLSSEDSPDRDRSFWFLLPTKKHPNGYTTLTTFRTPDGHDFRLQAASREHALEGFESEAKAMGL